MERDNRLNTLERIKELHERGGEYFFSEKTRRFFRSRVSSMVYPTGITAFGTLFVTSEKESHQARRWYTVRRAVLKTDADGFVTGCSLSTEGQFQAYGTSQQAHRAARRIRDKEQRTHRPEWFTEG